MVITRLPACRRRTLCRPGVPRAVDRVVVALLLLDDQLLLSGDTHGYLEDEMSEPKTPKGRSAKTKAAGEASRTPREKRNWDPPQPKPPASGAAATAASGWLTVV